MEQHAPFGRSLVNSTNSNYKIGVIKIRILDIGHDFYVFVDYMTKIYFNHTRFIIIKIM